MTDQANIFDLPRQKKTAKRNVFYLGTGAVGRNNNLNLMRMIAAFAVLVSHAWPLDQGIGTEEPLRTIFDKSLGTLAVYVFFVISGFLITASFQRSTTIRRFLAARFLRLFPGLLVSLVLVGLVLGPMVTTLSLAEYFSADGTWTFILRNATLAFPQYSLPGVFETNPYPAVEGSIWTLIHEVLCYCMVLIVGMLGLLSSRRGMFLFFLIYSTTWIITQVSPLAFPQRLLTLQGLSLPFVFGMVGWVWRDHIKLSIWVVVALGVLWWAARATVLADLCLVAFLSYAIAWLAYVPAGPVRLYNHLGDYSYGIYIYAFPIQGLVAWFFGSLGPGWHILIAAIPTAIISIASWHLIEKPAISLLQRRKA